MTDDGLVTALRLLFDGRDPTTIGAALHEALGENDQSVWWHLGDHIPIAAVYVWDGECVDSYLDASDRKFVGTDKDMRDLLKDIQHGGIGDYAADAMHNDCCEAVDKWAEEHPNLITQEVTP